MGYGGTMDPIMIFSMMSDSRWLVVGHFLLIQRFCPYPLNYCRYCVRFTSKYGILGYDETNGDIADVVRFKMSNCHVCALEWWNLHFMQNNPPRGKGYYRFTASVQISVYNVFIACILPMSMSPHVVCICYRFIGSVDRVFVLVSNTCIGFSGGSN